MITKIRIRNFRSFEDTTVGLKPFNVLIGPNDSGKSNFFDAFLVIREMMWSKLDKVFSRMPHLFDDVLFQYSKRESISFNVEGKTMTELQEQPFEFKYLVKISRDEKGDLHILTERLEIKRKNYNGWIKYINRTGEITRVKEIGKRNGVSYHFDSDRCAISLLSDLKRHAYIRAVERELSFTWFYYFKPSEMKRIKEIKEETSPVLDIDGSNLSNVLLHIKKNHPDKFKNLKKSLKDAIPDVEDLKISTQEKWIFVTVKQRQNNQVLTLPLWSVSDGLLRFLAILSIVYNPATPSMLFFEELENGIHPHRLRTAVELMQFLSLEPQFCQVLITTHSPYLVDYVIPKNVLVVEKVLGVTTIKPLWRKPGISKLLEDFSLGEAWFSGSLGGIP